MNFDEWFDFFQPIKNQYDNGASYDGALFETYGNELEFVKHAAKTKPETVWTIVESSESDSLYLLNGFRIVNRLGYFITNKPNADKSEFSILIWSADEIADFLPTTTGQGVTL